VTRKSFRANYSKSATGKEEDKRRARKKCNYCSPDEGEDAPNDNECSEKENPSVEARK
jgi:hypothetical protein